MFVHKLQNLWSRQVSFFPFIVSSRCKIYMYILGNTAVFTIIRSDTYDCSLRTLGSIKMNFG